MKTYLEHNTFVFLLVLTLPFSTFTNEKGGIKIVGDAGVVDPSDTLEEELDRLIDGGIKTYYYQVKVGEKEALSSAGATAGADKNLKLSISSERPHTVLEISAISSDDLVKVFLSAKKLGSEQVLAKMNFALSLSDSRRTTIDQLLKQISLFGEEADQQVPLTDEEMHEGPVSSFGDMAELAVLIVLRAFQPDHEKEPRLTVEYRRLLLNLFDKMQEIE